jgi:hypothetical protein
MYLSFGLKVKFNLSLGSTVKLRVSYHLVTRRHKLLILRLELRITLGLRSGLSDAACLGVGLRVPLGLAKLTHDLFSNGSFITVVNFSSSLISV